MPGLREYISTGEYHVYFSAHGQPVKAKLGAVSLSKAKDMLLDLQRQHRGKKKEPGSKRTITFGQARIKYLFEFDSKQDIKPSTRHYRHQIVDAILKSWPGLEDMDVRKITEEAVLEWASGKVDPIMKVKTPGYADKYSKQRYNNSVDTIWAIMQVAVDAGYIGANPCEKLTKKRITIPKLDLPSPSQFKAFVAAMRTGGGRMTEDAADFAELLAYSGCRLTEGGRIPWQDVKFSSNELQIWGDPIQGNKNYEPRTIPMNLPLRTLLEKMRADRGGAPKKDERVAKVYECQRTMDRACAAVGITRLTHHNLRDLFATSALECNIPVPMVADWIGHKDHGVTVLKRYWNTRKASGQDFAKRLTFTS